VFIRHHNSGKLSRLAGLPKIDKSLFTGKQGNSYDGGIPSPPTGSAPVKSLAYWLVLGLVPLASASAQVNPSAAPSSSDGPVLFTLTIDDEMIAALRAGQSLLSTIPPSIRGNVDKVRIEYKPAAPATGSSGSSGSILNRDSAAQPTRFDAGQFGQPPGQNTSSPSGANLNSGLNRPTGNPSPNSAPPLSNGSNWNQGTNPRPWENTAGTPNNSPLTGGFFGSGSSSAGLTPINERDGWFFPTRRDSNASGIANMPIGGIQTSTPSGATFQGIDRSSYPSSFRDSELYSAPPLARTLPPLDFASGSPGTGGPNALTDSVAADNAPAVGANQLLSKPPSETSQLLAQGGTSPTENRTLVYLFMLLLCSIGLNIYLGWISRGFYVRYHQLSAELRDTFSSAAGGSV
jgi:hypothetical protein